MYQVSTTPHFERRLTRFIRRHPRLAGRLGRVITSLEADPFQPQLELHPLRGELGGLHAVSLTQAYRIVLRLDADRHEIVLRDIGSHDEVYR